MEFILNNKKKTKRSSNNVNLLKKLNYGYNEME